jgi:hypothetical protein
VRTTRDRAEELEQQPLDDELRRGVGDAHLRGEARGDASDVDAGNDVAAVERCRGAAESRHERLRHDDIEAARRPLGEVVLVRVARGMEDERALFARARPARRALAVAAGKDEGEVALLVPVRRQKRAARIPGLGDAERRPRGGADDAAEEFAHDSVYVA